MGTIDPAYYLSKITSAHCNQPQYMEWVGVLLRMVADVATLFESMDSSFSIDQAVGKQLDMIGSMNGVQRRMIYTADCGDLNDDDFREYIRAQIIRARWNGTIQGMYELWNSVYPRYKLQIVDNMDMSQTIEIRGDLSPALTEMVQLGLILPVPMGVYVTYTIIAFVIPESKIAVGGGLFGACELTTKQNGL